MSPGTQRGSAPLDTPRSPRGRRAGSTCPPVGSVSTHGGSQGQALRAGLRPGLDSLPGWGPSGELDCRVVAAASMPPVGLQACPTRQAHGLAVVGCCRRGPGVKAGPKARPRRGLGLDSWGRRIRSSAGGQACLPTCHAASAGGAGGSAPRLISREASGDGLAGGSGVAPG